MYLLFCFFIRIIFFGVCLCHWLLSLPNMGLGILFCEFYHNIPSLFFFQVWHSSDHHGRNRLWKNSPSKVYVFSSTTSRNRCAEYDIDEGLCSMTLNTIMMFVLKRMSRNDQRLWANLFFFYFKVYKLSIFPIYIHIYILCI